MRYLLFLSLLFIYNSTEAQFYKKLDVEFVYNYSITLNRDSFTEVQFIIGKVPEREPNLGLRNYNFSIGYQFSNWYNLRLRFARFNVGRRIDGSIYGIHSDVQVYKDLKDVVLNNSIGVLNEIKIPTRSIDIGLALGFDRQNYDLKITFSDY